MLECSGLSDKGCVRKNNEDAFWLEPKRGLYIVADGMGGAQAGEHASRLAVEAVAAFVKTLNGTVTPENMAQAFEQANANVRKAAAADHELEGMGTTLVAAVEQGEDLLIASVGDSRAYSCRNGQLKAITEDQSWVNEVGRRIGMEEEALRVHPMRHVLTMAIGVGEKLRVNQYRHAVEPGETILLCSDGLYGVVPEPVIKEAINNGARTMEEKCRYLIEAARDAGGPDNITVVLLRRSA